MSDPSTRKEKRTPVTLKIKFKSATIEQFIERYSMDVSQGGIFIRTKEPLAVGTQLRFEFQLQDASPLIAGEGQVVWTRDYDANRAGIAPGMGVRFARLTEESRGTLDRILAGKPGGGNTPEPRFEATSAPLGGSGSRPALGASGSRPALGASPPFGARPLAPPRAASAIAPAAAPLAFGGATGVEDDFDDDVFKQPTKVQRLEDVVAAGQAAGHAPAVAPGGRTAQTILGMPIGAGNPRPPAPPAPPAARASGGRAAQIPAALPLDGLESDLDNAFEEFNDVKTRVPGSDELARNAAVTGAVSSTLGPAARAAIGGIDALSNVGETPESRPSDAFPVPDASALEAVPTNMSGGHDVLTSAPSEPRLKVLPGGAATPPERPVRRTVETTAAEGTEIPRPAMDTPPAGVPAIKKRSSATLLLVGSLVVIGGAGAAVMMKGSGSTPTTAPGPVDLRAGTPGTPTPAQPPVVPVVPVPVAAITPDAAPAGFTVETTPPGATLEVDGVVLPGVTPLVVPRLVAGRPAKLVARLACHVDGKLAAVPQEGKPLALTLKPMPRALEVTSEPAGAQISLDGKPAGFTPRVVVLKGAERDPAAPHVISLRRTGYAPFETTVAPGGECVAQAGLAKVAVHAALEKVAVAVVAPVPKAPVATPPPAPTPAPVVPKVAPAPRPPAPAPAKVEEEVADPGPVAPKVDTPPPAPVAPKPKPTPKPPTPAPTPEKPPVDETTPDWAQ